MQHPEEDYYTELHIKDETPETIERNLFLFPYNHDPATENFLLLCQIIKKKTI